MRLSRMIFRRMTAAACTLLLAALSVSVPAFADEEADVIQRAHRPTRFPGGRIAPQIGIGITQFDTGAGTEVRMQYVIGFEWWLADRFAVGLSAPFQPSSPSWLTLSPDVQWVFYENSVIAPYLKGQYGHGFMFDSAYPDFNEFLLGGGLWLFLGPLHLRLGGLYGVRAAGGQTNGVYVIEPAIGIAF